MLSFFIDSVPGGKSHDKPNRKMLEINKSESVVAFLLFLKGGDAPAQAGCKETRDAKRITLSRNQCGRVPFPSVRILIFLRGAMSAISIMKLSSWPRSNLEGLKTKEISHGFTTSLHLDSLSVLRLVPCQQPQIKSL